MSTTNNQRPGSSSKPAAAPPPPRRISPPVHLLPERGPEPVEAGNQDQATEMFLRSRMNAVPSRAGDPVAGGRGKERITGDGPEVTAASRLIVEDDAEALEPGQMRRGDYLDRLEHAVLERAELALKGTVWTAQGCPWIAYWFGHYRSQNAVHLERAIHRYIPDAAAGNAERYVELVAARIERGLVRFARTGSLGDIPREAPRSLPAGVEWSDVMGTTGDRRAAYMERLERMRESNPAAAGALERAMAAPAGDALQQSDVERVRGKLGDGAPLPGDVRDRMSRAFGEDVGDVRVHTDAPSAHLAAEENARAFAVGNDVVFGAGEYRPGTTMGDGLIAHELAHVMQQRDAAEEEPAGTDSAAERDAERSTGSALVRSFARGLRSFRGLIDGLRENAKPALKSGLQLARCTDNLKDPDVVRRHDSLAALGQLDQFNTAGIPILPLPSMDKEAMRKIGYDPDKFTFTYVDGGHNEVLSFIGSRYRVEYNGKFIGYIHVQYQHYPHSYYKDNLYQPLPGDVQIQIARTDGNDPQAKIDLENLHLTGFGGYLQGATLHDLGAAEAESRLEEMHQGGGLEPEGIFGPGSSSSGPKGHGVSMAEEEPVRPSASSHTGSGKLNEPGEAEGGLQGSSGKVRATHEVDETTPHNEGAGTHGNMGHVEESSKPNPRSQHAPENESDGATPNHPATTSNTTRHDEHVEEEPIVKEETSTTSSHEKPADEGRDHETDAPTTAQGPAHAEPNVVHAEKPKPKYTVNPQHHPNHAKVKNREKDPLPADAEEVYQTAIENPKVQEKRPHMSEYWGINNEGVYYRYQGANGEVHWTAGSKSPTGHSRNPPDRIKEELDARFRAQRQTSQ